jgi:hypothetical protein
MVMGIAAPPVLTHFACAQAYPSRPVAASMATGHPYMKLTAADTKFYVFAVNVDG